MSDVVSQLRRRGVIVHCPDSVHVEASVDAGRIAEGVVIHAGCRIAGAETSIGPGSIVGREEPATLDNCQLGAGVMLGGGFFSNVTLLDRVTIGAGAHMRPGTLLEEQASCGHTVALKQTVMLPFAVTGSLVNFCDCLLSGGTSRRNHSEVGSSYVHFNYTPHQDKATPSLLGDVPRGVMLDQPPIFLGGQGGLVGPSRIEFGTIVAAGTILRGDVTVPGHLVSGDSERMTGQTPYNPKLYGNVSRRLTNNFVYLGNLFALLEWYGHVRPLFLDSDLYARACHAGALSRIREGIDERLKRLAELVAKLEISVKTAESDPGNDISLSPYRLQREFAAKWPEAAARVAAEDFGKVAEQDREAVLAAIEPAGGAGGYIRAIEKLAAEDKSRGSAWLQAVVDKTVSLCTV